MDFELMLGKLKKTVKKAVKTTIKVSNDAIDYGKCKIKISALKSKIEDNYLKIGEAVYSQSVGDDGFDTEFLEKLCNEISLWNEEINSLNAIIKKEAEKNADDSEE